MIIQNHCHPRPWSQGLLSAQHKQVPELSESVTVYSHTRVCQAHQYTADMLICQCYCVMLSQHLDVGCPPFLSDPLTSICLYSVPSCHLLQGHPGLYLHHEVFRFFGSPL